MAAINATVIMQFVDDDESQILEQLGPAGMMRQDAAVQHIRVCKHHVSAVAHSFPRVLRRVAVIGEGPNLSRKAVRSPLKSVELVFSKRFGWKQIHRARIRLAQQHLKNRQVVTQRLSACSGRYDYRVLAGFDLFKRFRLMGIEALDAMLFQCFAQLEIYPCWNLGELALGRRLVADGADG